MTTGDAHESTGPIDGRVDREVVSRVGDDPYTLTTIHVDRPCEPHVAAAGQRARCHEDRGGDFYSDCSACLNCHMPHVVAPDLMANVQHPGPTEFAHCVFTRTPTTPEEIERAIDAMCESEVCAIRYGGSDPAILRRIAARRGTVLKDSTDHGPARP